MSSAPAVRAYVIHRAARGGGRNPVAAAARAAGPGAVPPGDRPEMRAWMPSFWITCSIPPARSALRARVSSSSLGSIDFNLGELSRTVTRLKEQLRKLEIETETQILHGHEEKGGSHRGDFDPLELDRYSSIQQFSRALAETASDVRASSSSWRR